MRDANSYSRPSDASVPPIADAAPGGANAQVLTDPAVWWPVADDGVCPLYQAHLAPDPFPHRVWSNCGTGCLVANGTPGIETALGVNAQTSAGAYLVDDVYLSLDQYFASAEVQQIVRLSDGMTVAAAEIRSPASGCVFGVPGGDAPLLVTAFHPGDASSSYFFGWASRTAGDAMQWQSSWLASPSPANHRFDFNGRHGLAFASGTVALVESSAASAFEKVDTTQASVFATSARADTLLWSKLGTDGGVIEGWTPDAGAATLATLAGHAAPVALAIDEQHMAWIAATGDVLDGMFDSAVVYSSPLAARPQDLAPRAGPSLPASSNLSTLKLGGDYVGTIGCTGPTLPACRLFVAQLSTGSLWSVPAQRSADAVYTSVLAVSPTEVVLGEIDWPVSGRGVQEIQRLVRLTLASIQAASP